jgi:putative ABC transport system ATP-binding protein
MGPSGCGKSTLLNIIGMLDNPSAGEYLFLGEEVSKYPERKLAQLRKRNIGFIFQSFNLIDELTVFANVELPLLYQRVAPSDRKKRVDAVLEKIGIIARRDHLPQQLSGGQQQRVAVARALVSAPKLILADEPTGNLDTTNGEEVMKLLVKLNEEGTTVIMVTHSRSHAEYGRRVVNMLDGRVLSENVGQVRKERAHG